MAIANLAMATGNIGRKGVGVLILCAARIMCRVRAIWVRSRMNFPATAMFPMNSTRDIFDKLWGVKIQDEPGLRIPNMLDAAVDGTFKGIYIQGEDILQSRSRIRNMLLPVWKQWNV